MGDLAPERREEARLVQRLVPHVAVEVAIRAFRRAERPVHVDAEARIPRRMIAHAPDVIRARRLASGRRPGGENGGGLDGSVSV